MPLPRRLPWLMATALFALYCAVSVNRHRQMLSTGFDLGIFEQAVRAYAELRSPVAELKGPGFNLLGDHFHLILIVLAPFYRLAPSPVTLLVAQAALLAVSAVPVVRLAAGRLGRWPAVAIGIAYGLSWGLVHAVVFDFHEISFAVPLLAFTAEALATGRWPAAAAWAMPLLLVKEDLAATVTVVGGYLFVAGRRRLGLVTAAVAVTVGALVILVVIPALSYWGAYTYLGTVQPHGDDVLLRLVLPATKAHTALVLLAPTGFVAVRSPVLVLALPTLAWRFWSTNPNYWGTDYHYSAVLMPIVFIALVDGLHRRPGTRRRLATLIVPALALAYPVAGLGPGPTPWDLIDSATRTVSPTAIQARRVLRTIPDGATVVAANRVAPQLTARCHVYLFPEALRIPDKHGGRLRPQYAAVTTDTDPGDLALLGELGYRILSAGGDVTVYWPGGATATVQPSVPVFGSRVSYASSGLT